MYGFGILVPDYYDYMIDIFGGVRAAVPITLFTRLVVGIGWFRMLQRAGKPGWHALIPLWGEFQVFRIVYNDTAFAAIYAGSTMMAWVGMMGVQHQMVSIFWFVNGVFWWLMCFFTCIAFKVSYLFWPIYAILPWAGALFFGFHDLPKYDGPWDPQTPDAPDRKAERAKAERRAERRALSKKKNYGKGKR